MDSVFVAVICNAVVELNCLKFLAACHRRKLLITDCLFRCLRCRCVGNRIKIIRDFREFLLHDVVEVTLIMLFNRIVLEVIRRVSDLVKGCKTLQMSVFINFIVS